MNSFRPHACGLLRGRQVFRPVSFVISLGLCLVALCASASAQDVHLELAIDRETITMDESVTLHIIVSGISKRISRPNVRGLDGFDVISQGSSMKYSNINGVTETSTTFNLELSPEKVGAFTLGPATIEIGGQGYTSNVLTLTVTDDPQQQSARKKPPQKDVFLEASVNNKSPYVGQQVVLTVRFYHASTLLSQPSYTPPQTTDFWSDMITPQRSYYSTLEGKRYRVLEINTALFPTRSGNLSIGRARLETQVESSRRKRQFGFGSLFNRGEAVSVRTRPIDLKVKPLPAEGKPANFTGAVGDFTITASADQRTVEVNTPVTVSFRISGIGNIKVLPKPELPELAEFRVYSGAGDEQITKNQTQLGGVKTFEEIFIPKRQGKLVIPAVSYNYFNPQKSRYVTIQTRPIELNVTSSTQQLSEPVSFAFPVGERIGAAMTSIRYIKQERSDFHPRGEVLIGNRTYLLANFLPLLAVGGALMYRRHRNRMEGDIGYARARAANRIAKKRLKRASQLADVQTAEKFFGEIRLAILAFVADKLNISHHGLTLEELSEKLAAAGFSESEVTRCRELIQRADFVRYSSGTIDEKDISDSLVLAEEIIVKLQEANIV